MLIPQRDAVGRLARRSLPAASDELVYRFRDVYDHLVRLTEEAVLFQDRISGILEAHLSTVSNRLNMVMKLLTVISPIFLPLTVLTSMWGMNVPLPAFPGGEAAQVLVGQRSVWGMISLIMLVVFKSVRAGCSGSTVVAKILKLPVRPRQPDCRRRSCRAPGVGDQGARRELDRRWCATAVDCRRDGWQEANPG